MIIELQRQEVNDVECHHGEGGGAAKCVQHEDAVVLHAAQFSDGGWGKRELFFLFYFGNSIMGIKIGAGFREG